MPYADPQKRKESAARRYLKNKARWKNNDGTWKKSNTDHRANGRKHYWKHRDIISEKRKTKLNAEREARTKHCPVCHSYETLVYDHDHKTGLFRAYICSSCNLALGHAKDSPEILRALAEYLDGKRTITS